ncbi:hypothetical protein ACWCP6_20590 [Streptomyces sp. NPDC002004]
MWPGQPPGGGTNPQGQGQDPNTQGSQGQQMPGGPPNPYAQPGYHQPNPYMAQQMPPGAEQTQPPQNAWHAPTVPGGAPEPPRPRNRRTALVAILAATTVVIAAGVTALVVLGGGKDDTAGPGPTKSPTGQSSSPADETPSAEDREEKPTVSGWQVVVNPKQGIAFDVPPDWSLKSTSWTSWVSDNNNSDDKPLVAFAAPAFLKEHWCTSDPDKDGSTSYTPLGGAGSRGNNGAKNTRDIARTDSALWVYGGYTQPHRNLVTSGPVQSYTTKSGITGSLGTASSRGVEKHGKCDFDGKATTFAFKNAQGDFVSWSFNGVRGVKDEIPDTTIRKILSTVRLYKDDSGS